MEAVLLGIVEGNALLQVCASGDELSEMEQSASHRPMGFQQKS
jgi:hypothetical protein